ncbi:MAG: MFS transporter [Thiolinea sp.]
MLLAFLAFLSASTSWKQLQPSLVAKYASVDAKGTAMGIFTSSQFMGIFAGGSLGGLVLHRFGTGGVFLFSALMAGVWLVVPDPAPSQNFTAAASSNCRREQPTGRNCINTSKRHPRRP